jgi:hypothetical protein
LKVNGPQIQLQKELTLNEFETKLKQAGEVQEQVKFFAPDGASIAKTTRMHYLLHIPYFIIRLDQDREYNIMSEKSFSLRNKKFTLDAREKAIYDTCKQLNMRDQKALEISRFLSRFEVDLAEKEDWGNNEILIMIREVLARKASTVKEEKDVLE